MEQLQHIAGAKQDPDRRAAALAALEQLKRHGLRERREAKLWAAIQRYAPEVLVQGWDVAKPILSAYTKKRLGLQPEDSILPKK